MIRFVEDGKSPPPFFVQCLMMEDGRIVEYKYRLLRIEGAKAIYGYMKDGSDVALNPQQETEPAGKKLES